MGWRQAFDAAMRELGRSGDSWRGSMIRRSGWASLHGEVTQSRLKIQEALQTGVTGLREENREVRRRQDRMISDLNDTRAELRGLLDLLDTMRAQAGPGWEEPAGGGQTVQGDGGQRPRSGDTQVPVGDGPAGAQAAPPHTAASGVEQQRETMDNAQQQPQHQGSNDGNDSQELGLRGRSRPLYHGRPPPGRPGRRRPPAMRTRGSPTGFCC